MKFVYQARDADGAVRSGDISAETAEEAARTLRREGLYLLSLDERTDEDGGGFEFALPKRIRRQEVVYLTNQLAVMLDAGVPLAQGLDGLALQTLNPALRSILERVHARVQGGDDLSATLAEYPKVFDATYVNLVRASEASGTLPSVLEQLAERMQKDVETRQKVLGALVYPAAILLVCVGVCVFLLAYVFPKITPLFATRKAEIPRPTAIMMSISHVLVHQWYFVLLGLVLAGIGLWFASRQRWFRVGRDWIALHVPIIGPMLRKVAISRSLRTLATTVNAGVPMLEAIELSSTVTGNSFFETCWSNVGDQVAAGKQIHESLVGHGLFPPTVLQMIASGEATGKLGHVLVKVSDHFDREVETAIKSATSLIEPLMVFTMGGVIGSIALAMLLPIFTLSTSH